MFEYDSIQWLNNFSHKLSSCNSTYQHRKSYSIKVKQEIDHAQTEPTIHCNRWRPFLWVNSICRDSNKYIDLAEYTTHCDRCRWRYPLDKRTRVHNLFGNPRSRWSSVGSWDMSLDMKRHTRCRPCHLDMSSGTDLLFSSSHGCNHAHNRAPWLRTRHRARFVEHLPRIWLLHNDRVCTLHKYWYRSRHDCMFWRNRMDHESVDRLFRQRRPVRSHRMGWFGQRWLRTRSTRREGVEQGARRSLTPLSVRHSLPKLVTEVLNEPSGSSRSSRTSFLHVQNRREREALFTVTSIGVCTAKTSDLFHVRLFHSDVNSHSVIPFTTDTIRVTQIRVIFRATFNGQCWNRVDHEQVFRLVDCPCSSFTYVHWHSLELDSMPLHWRWHWFPRQQCEIHPE